MNEDEFTTLRPLTEAALLKKLVELTRLMGSIPKDKENAHFHYKYLSEAAVKTKLQPLLIQLGLVAVPQYKLISNVGELAIVSCTLSIFDSESGAALFPEPTAVGSGSDKADKGPLKAMTSALKYAWTGLLCVPTGEDPEADSSVDRPEPQRPRALPAAAAPPRVPPQPSAAPPPAPTIGAGWETRKIEVTNVERKSANPKAPYLVSVLDSEKPLKLFGDKNYERMMDLMRAGEPIEVKVSKREDKWGTDVVIEAVPHAETADVPF